MNHPRRDLLEELRWMAGAGLGFVDLTLEPPAAASWQVDPAQIRQALADLGLKVVGHTAYYLPLGSVFDSLRSAAVEEFKRCLEVFAAVGARWMNIHPDRYTPMHDRAFAIERNLLSLQELQEFGRSVGVGVMIENMPGDFNTPDQLGDLLDPVPDLGLHLDIGHANLKVSHNTTESILRRYGSRLRHVHLSDNKGGTADLHLPLGVGDLDVPRQIRALKATGYDDTITLEVFAPDRRYFEQSRDVLRALWDTL